MVARKPDPKPTPRWASLNEAAAYYHCHRSTMRGYISAGLLPARDVNGRLKIDLNDVDQLGTPVPSSRRAAS